MNCFSLDFAKYSSFLTVYEIKFCHKPVSYLMSWFLEITEIKIFVAVIFMTCKKEGEGERERERESAFMRARPRE
jgi:hypothetical protein